MQVGSRVLWGLPFWTPVDTLAFERITDAGTHTCAHTCMHTHTHTHAQAAPQTLCSSNSVIRVATRPWLYAGNPEVVSTGGDWLMRADVVSRLGLLLRPWRVEGGTAPPRSSWGKGAAFG